MKVSWCYTSKFYPPKHQRRGAAEGRRERGKSKSGAATCSVTCELRRNERAHYRPHCPERWRKSSRLRKEWRLSPERERSMPFIIVIPLSWKSEGLSPQKWNHFCGYADRGIVIFRSRFREIFTARANLSEQMIVLFNLLFWVNVKCQLHSSSQKGYRIMFLTRWSLLSLSYHELAILTKAQNIFEYSDEPQCSLWEFIFLVYFFGKHFSFIYLFFNTFKTLLTIFTCSSRRMRGTGECKLSDSCLESDLICK